MLRTRIFAEGRAVSAGIIVGVGANVIALPFVTRLYGAAALGTAGMVLALVALLVPALLQGVPQGLQSVPRESALGTTYSWIRGTSRVVLAGVMFACLAYLSGLVDGQMLSSLLLGWAIAVLTTITQIVYAARVRLGQYGAVGVSRGMQGVFSAVMQVLIGFVSPSAPGLLAAQAIALGLSALLLATRSPGLHRHVAAARRVSLDSAQPGALSSSARIQSAMGGVLLQAFLQSPVVLAGLFYSQSTAGQVAVVTRVLSVPHTFLGRGLGLYVQQMAGAVIRSGRGSLQGLLADAQKKMFRTALVSLVAGVVLATFMPRLLGPGFGQTTAIMVALLPAYFMQVVVGPTLGFLLASHAFGLYLRLMITRTGLSVGAGLSAAVCGAPIAVSLAIYSISALLGQVLAMQSGRRTAVKLDADLLKKRGDDV